MTRNVVSSDLQCSDISVKGSNKEMGLTLQAIRLVKKKVTTHIKEMGLTVYLFVIHSVHNVKHSIGGAMVLMLASNVVDCGFEPQSSQ